MASDAVDNGDALGVDGSLVGGRDRRAREVVGGTKLAIVVDGIATIKAPLHLCDLLCPCRSRKGQSHLVADRVDESKLGGIFVSGVGVIGAQFVKADFKRVSDLVVLAIGPVDVREAAVAGVAGGLPAELLCFLHLCLPHLEEVCQGSSKEVNRTIGVEDTGHGAGGEVLVVTLEEAREGVPHLTRRILEADAFRYILARPLHLSAGGGELGGVSVE